ncbi:MAG: Lrp/AsnC family transcriptional regulator [Archaeoglobaceae archaeon]|nr:Lrp/AsnC family transcriptional regulator [Archaeoglobaceae archaeon]MCX8152418.1 Lrp/AsnC family transcriptional regulator [Archaeoglobaceae archaeon]MDW8013758.1 Lrp/AsnC family transcriptional regulator [Archaeoglobaceae archaeon]
MDEKDRKIVEILMLDGRIPKVKIAKSLNITEAAVRKRIQNLENKKIILLYKAVVNYKTAGLSASITGFDVESEELWNVVENLKQLEFVKSLWLTAGDHTILAEIVASNTEELSKFHEDISKIKGVKKVCPAIILDILK